jgi:hypothetical protein
MKWYYWLLIPLTIFLYEVIRRRGSSIFRVQWRLILNFIRKALSKIIIGIMQVLRGIYVRICLETAKSGVYVSLAPTENADTTGVYEQVLVENLAKSDVMNIALTGPYGSGKSSIIRTFMRRHPEFRYLNISLAAVTEGAEKVAVEKKEPNKNIEDNQHPIDGWTSQTAIQIEYSILQQIFYHVTDRQIPFSRFKRIRTTSKLLLLLVSISTFIFSLSVWFLFFKGATATFPEQWQKWLTDHKNSVSITNWLFFGIGFFMIIHSLIRLYQHTQQIKLNLNSAELEISPNKDASALNKHLDEILYFFSVIPIDVVVIEDLDRFQNPEIFIKLREINTLINNSKAIKRKVTFLYALRDDVFIDEHRTKFFEFIAPVIPTTNASNAASKLQNEINKMNLPTAIPEAFLNDLGFFIQETRLINNIANEFRIYNAHLKNFEVNYTHLLAIIVYKNKYPTDFSDLQYNRGIMYAHFNRRPFYIEKILENHKEKRKQLTEKLEVIKHNYLKGIHELRLIYLAELFKEIHSKNYTYGFKGKIIVNNYEKNLKELASDEYFKILKNIANIIYLSNNGQHINSGIAFSTIEKLVNQQSYDSRAQSFSQSFIQDRDQLERELEQTNLIISQVRHYSMQEIMSQQEMEEFETPINGHSLLIYLTSSGYLNETYSYYLSQFTEGEISKNDFDFIWAVKHRNQLDWTHPLEKLPAVVKKLNPREFSYPETLNFDMFAYLLSTTQENSEIQQRLIGQLKKLDKKAVLFIDQFIEKGNKVPETIRILCAEITNLWQFIELQSNYTLEKKNQYLQLIINHADIEDIINQNENDLLSNYISQNALLLYPQTYGLDSEKVKLVCNSLQVNFDLPDQNIQPETEMIKYIYEHNHYILNQIMLSLLLKNILSDYNEATFQPAQYTRILQSHLQPVKIYIEANFEKYIVDIFLKIKNHNQESQDTILKVLNSDKITDNTKNQVIIDTEFQLEYITDCTDSQLWDLLLEHARIKPTWANIFAYYGTHDEHEQPRHLTQALVEFLNMPNCVGELKKEKVTENSEMCEMLCDIFTSGRLDIGALPHLIQSIDFQMIEVDFGLLDELHTQTLLQYDKVVFEITSLNSLKQHHSLQAANWIGANWGQFLTIFSQLQLNATDWINLLENKRPNTNADQQNWLLKKIPSKEVSAVLNEGIAIPNETLEDKDVTADYETLEKLSLNLQVSKESIAIIFTKSMDGLNIGQARQILFNMHGEYAVLVKDQHPRVQKTKIMENLLQRLRDKEFFISSFETKNKYIHIISLSAETDD